MNVTALKDQIVVAEIVSQLSILTNRSEGLSPGNLNSSVMMLNRLADLRRGSTESPNEKEISVGLQLFTLTTYSNLILIDANVH